MCQHDLIPSILRKQIKKISVTEFAAKAHAYITIDQGLIEPGSTQRKGGAHVDGFQGARINPKNEINYSYIVSNLTPTACYDQVRINVKN